MPVLDDLARTGLRGAALIEGEPLFDGIDVEFLDGELVVGRQVMPRWIGPRDEYVFDGVTYDVYGFSDLTADGGRRSFRVFVRPRATPAGPTGESPEPAPG